MLCFTASRNKGPNILVFRIQKLRNAETLIWELKIKKKSREAAR